MTKGTFVYRLGRKLVIPYFKLKYKPEIVNAHYIPSDGPLVVACNHMHVLDQCVIIIQTPRFIRYMAKKEYFEGKNAWFFKAAGCIPVDREKKDTAAVKEALKTLKAGGAIGIFPEGTRNKTDAVLLPFKFGATGMAKKAGAWMLPCALTGEFKKNGKLRLEFAEPFKLDNMTVEEANDRLYDTIYNMLVKVNGEPAKAEGAAEDTAEDVKA